MRKTVDHPSHANPHAGWKTTLNGAQSWVQFNEVDFGRGGQKSIEARATAGGKESFEVRLDRQDGPVIARVKVGGDTNWKLSKASAKKVPAGVHDLFVVHTGSEPMELDWISFR